MLRLLKCIAGTATVGFLCAASVAAAQHADPPHPLIIRATIEKVHGGMLEVKSRNGVMLKLTVAKRAPVNEVVKRSLADISKGSYLAITGTPQPDGSQKAVAILIFPKGFHPPAGFHPWDFVAHSTMTNAHRGGEGGQCPRRNANRHLRGRTAENHRAAERRNNDL
jgi:hypothetical protein